MSEKCFLLGTWVRAPFSHPRRWCGNTQLLRAASCETFSVGQAVSAEAQLFKKRNVKNVRAISRACGWFSCHVGTYREAEQQGQEGGFTTSSSSVLYPSSPVLENSINLVQKTESLIVVIQNSWSFARWVACPPESLIFAAVSIRYQVIQWNEMKDVVAVLTILTHSYLFLSSVISGQSLTH